MIPHFVCEAAYWRVYMKVSYFTKSIMSRYFHCSLLLAT